MKKVKLVALLILIALLITVLVQNAWQAEVRLLFWRPKLPATVMILVTLLVGFALGLTASALWRRRAEAPKGQPRKG